MSANSILGRAVRRLGRTRGFPEASAWFDEPDGATAIRRRARNERDRAILASWVRDGYAIVEQLIPHELIDAMQADLDELFSAGAPIDGLELEGIHLEDGSGATLSHHELLELPENERLEARDRSSWRVHAFFERSAAADAIRRHDELVRLATMILGRDCDAHYSINFRNGSRQGLHEDTAVFQLGVPTLICGAWIACEDVTEGAGPLVYYPGSHRRPLFSGFDDYPRTNLQSTNPQTYAAYMRHVTAAAELFEPANFLARKGDVLFWHGMLIHGGAPITAPGSTRRSYVLHFIPDGIDVASAT